MTKDTPSFDGTDYKRYRQLAKMWATVSTVAEEHKALTLVMFLKGKALDIGLTIDEELLKTKKGKGNPATAIVGVELLLQKLDEVYLESDDTLSKYESFENLRRNPNQLMTEFILIFESLERDLKKDHGLTLPELVLAYKLLKAANLEPADERLARATCSNMTLQEMKKALLRLSDSQLKQQQAGPDNLPVKVKTEPCYLTSNETVPVGEEPTNEEIWFNKHRTFNPYNKSNNNAKPPRQCYGCGEFGHWIHVCPYLTNSPYHPNSYNGYHPNNQHIPPYQQQQNGPNRTHFASEESLMNNMPAKSVNYGIEKVTEKKHDGDETLNHAVIDTGASETVCGERWLNGYVNSIEHEQLNQIQEEPCNIMITYGNGIMKASRKLTLPLSMANQTVTLQEVLVVDADVPLLISLKAMKSLNMKIDCIEDQVSIGEIQLKAKSTQSGKYLIPLSVSMNNNLQPPDCPINYSECIQRTYQGKLLF